MADLELRQLERAARHDPAAAARLRAVRRRAGGGRRVRVAGYGGYSEGGDFNGLTGRVVREAGAGATYAKVALDEPPLGVRSEIYCEPHELVDLEDEEFAGEVVA